MSNDTQPITQNNDRHIAVGPVTQFTVNHDGDIFCNDGRYEYIINGDNARKLLNVLRVSEQARTAARLNTAD